MPQDIAAQIPTSQPEAAPVASPKAAELAETIIASDARVRLIQSARDIWLYRDLFLAFVVRDIKVRYKQTALGAIWVLLQPILVGGILSVVFNSIRGTQNGATPYSTLIFMAALVPWTSFAAAVQNAAMSMEANANMISKVYFPRMVIPGAYVCGSVVDFLIAFAALLAMAWWRGAISPMLFAWMPALLVLQLMAAMGLGLIFGALNAQYHDVKYVLPFMLQVGMLVSVLVELKDKTVVAQRLLCINPMAPVIDTYRALLNGTPIHYELLGQGAGIALALFVGGVWFFRRREAKLMDIL